MTHALPPPAEAEAAAAAAAGKCPGEKEPLGLRGPKAALKAPPLRLRSARPRREEAAGELKMELLLPLRVRVWWRDERLENRAFWPGRVENRSRSRSRLSCWLGLPFGMMA